MREGRGERRGRDFVFCFCFCVVDVFGLAGVIR